MPQTTMCKGLEACYVNRLNLLAIFLCPYRPCGYGYNCNHVTFQPFDSLSKCVNIYILASYINISLFLAPQRLHGYSCNRVTISKICFVLDNPSSRFSSALLLLALVNVVHSGFGTIPIQLPSTSIRFISTPLFVSYHHYTG